MGVAYLHAYRMCACVRSVRGAALALAVHKVPRSAAQAGILKPPSSHAHVCMWTIRVEMESQQWTDGLNLCGLYYEGYTDDLQQMLTKHSSATVSTYGVRRSHTNHAVKSNDKENLDTNTAQNSKVNHKN